MILTRPIYTETVSVHDTYHLVAPAHDIFVMNAYEPFIFTFPIRLRPLILLIIAIIEGLPIFHETLTQHLYFLNIYWISLTENVQAALQAPVCNQKLC